MPYLHVDLHADQTPKRHAPCGDLFEVRRDSSGSLVVLCDGIGSGMKAHLSAQFITSRFIERARKGTSLRQAFLESVKTLESNRSSGLPWGALSVARILPDGACALLLYEAPSPLLLNGRHALDPVMRPLREGGAVAFEAHCQLRSGDGVLLVSDGITQAGLGRRIKGMSEGWGIEGARREADLLLAEGADHASLPRLLLKKALHLWGEAGDDCTALVASCRRGVTVNILTGPPSRSELDAETVRSFMRSEGFHVVCGATTAKIVAGTLGRALEVDSASLNAIAPPRYRIEGLDLVTEGAITLNQLLNVIDADPILLAKADPVTELRELLDTADRVRIIQGEAVNPATRAIQYRQQGILLRHRIVPLLAEKLESMGKMVELARL